jgi:hypothetical protein
MTSLLIKIKDDSKADDVVRFLRDIPFLEVIAQNTNPSITIGTNKNSNNLNYDDEKTNSLISDLLEKPLVIKEFHTMDRESIYEC